MIDIPEFRQRLDSEKNLLVLDVRTPEDFAGEQGHIKEAVNIPVESLQQRMDEIGNYLEQPVAIVCRTDKKSAKAALLLTEEGFADVHIVRGGMTKWLDAGLPVVR
jgi:rhodanese-related sulfurtransferase